MAGLDLETFLHLLRADVGAWFTLGLIVVLLAVMTWTSWGSRRALRKCLVLSIAAHGGLVLYGSTVPTFTSLVSPKRAVEPPRERIQRIQLVQPTEPEGPDLAELPFLPGAEPTEIRPERLGSSWDRVPSSHLVSLNEPNLRPNRIEAPPVEAARLVEPPTAPPAEAAAFEMQEPEATAPEARPDEMTEPETARIAPDDAERAKPPLPSQSGGELPLIPAEGSLRLDRPRLDPRRNPERRAPDDLEAAVAEPLPVVSLPENRATASRMPPLPVAAADPDLPETPRLRVPGSGAGDLAPVPGDGNLRVSPLRRSRPGMLPPDVVPPLAPAAPPNGGVTGPLVSAPSTEPVKPRRTIEPPPALVATADPEPAIADPPRSSGIELDPAVADIDIRRRSQPTRDPLAGVPDDVVSRMNSRSTAIPVARVVPAPTPGLPVAPRRTAGRSTANVPEVYRSRLDPDRTALAVRAGASPASEQAVERALDWLKRHQDNDGRWNGGAARYADGTTARGEDSFTLHCPAGEICFGECFYAEADTALTGLALLAYLGAGYTHTDGPYAEVVGKGLEFLASIQKPDGDLRGPSKAVGMYCHAMATLALCEAYALTSDRRLRPAVEKAVEFAVRARSADGMAWRYLPGDTRGSDTSILGWVVMVLKSAREVGIAVPATTPAGALTWLDKVAGGRAGGLARYQPVEIARSQRDGEITPTMTAEAWVCRQFLGVGGPGAASDEAADYLLRAGPERGPFNIYYWYYGTLAMYQHGGEPWSRWNAQVRDQLVKRQRDQGHQAGSWDPDETDYGARGGRIYCTALATLSLEVYYRYLRLYDNPSTPPPARGPRPGPLAEDPVRRAAATGQPR